MSFDCYQVVESFYIHWPFCPSGCHCCPFVALAEHDEGMADYHEALYSEVETFIAAQRNKMPLKTIFFGGGTASIYPLDLLGTLIELLKSRCGFDNSYEMTMEVNPRTVTPEKLAAWKKCGINRLSIGVQNYNDEIHTKGHLHQHVQDVGNLLASAAPLFDNLSIDLILGLPGVSADEWRQMIEKVVSWPIKHVSLYFVPESEDIQLLATHHNQVPVQKVPVPKVRVPSDDEVASLYYWTIEQLEAAGIIHYEISNFAREGWESKHASVYWQHKPYKGFGLGACSFDGQVRSQNEKDLLKYLEGIRNTSDITLFTEQLSDKQVWLESLMLGLSQRRGMCLDDVLGPLAIKEKEEFCKKADELADAHLITWNDKRIALTPAGLSVANEVIVKLVSDNLKL